MAECHPVGLPVGDGGQGARREGHPRRPAVHPHQRAWPTRYVPIRAGTDIAFLGGDHQLHPRATSWTSASTSWPTPTPRRSSARTSATPRTSTGCSPATTRRRGTYDPTSWQYAGHGGGTADEPGSTASAQRETASAGCGTSRTARSVHGQTAARRDPAAPALRLPGAQAALRPLHPGDGRAGLRHPAGDVPRGGARRGPRTAAGTAPPRWSTRSAGPSTPSACSTSAPARSCSCCWATWAGPAAASWRCAGTPASRARPTSRRCSTCCPATCRCRTTPTSTTLRRLRGQHPAPRPEGLLGQRAGLHGQPAQGLLGRRGDRRRTTSASTTCRGSPATTAPTSTVLDMIDGKVKGYFLLGQNPAVGSAHGRAQRLGMANLDWLVVRDLYDDRDRDLLEGRARRSRPARSCTEESRTEVFFLPAASHVEKEGTFTQTQRLLQWRDKAVEPPGDCRSELWFFFHLGRMLRERLAGSTEPRDRPLLDLAWDYPTHGAHGEPERRGGAAGDQRLRRAPTGRPLSAYTEMKDDGSTAGGCWIYTGVYADGVNQAARRKPGSEQYLGGARVGLGVAGQPAASSTTAPPPTPTASRGASARRYVWWDAEQAASGPGTTCRTSRRPSRRTTVPPEGAAGPAGARRRRPVHHAGRRQGLAVRARPGCSTGRCRRTTSRPSRRCATRCTASRPTRPARCYARAGQPAQPEPAGGAQRGLPVRVHHLPADRAPHRRRHEPARCRTWPSCSRSCSCEVSPELAAERGLEQRRLGARSSPPGPRSRRGCW